MTLTTVPVPCVPTLPNYYFMLRLQIRLASSHIGGLNQASSSTSSTDRIADDLQYRRLGSGSAWTVIPVHHIIIIGSLKAARVQPHQRAHPHLRVIYRSESCNTTHESAIIESPHLGPLDIACSVLQIVRAARQAHAELRLRMQLDLRGRCVAVLLLLFHL